MVSASSYKGSWPDAMCNAGPAWVPARPQATTHARQLGGILGKTDSVLRDGCFSWTRAVSSADGPPKTTTRHVLLALSLYMSAKGDSCFPSITTLATDTGLSRKSVITHLQEAERLGWIARQKEPMPGKGKGWNRMTYVASAPARFRAQKVVKEVHHEPREGGEPDGEGGEPDGRKAVKEVHPMYSSDASNDAASPQPHELTLSGRVERALTSKRLTSWEDTFARSKLVLLNNGGKLSDPMRAKLMEILAKVEGDGSEPTAVNVPTKADQDAKTREDLGHDEELLQERVEEGGHIPPAVVRRCMRRRERLEMGIPPWLGELAEKHPMQQQEIKRKKLSGRQVDARLRAFAGQGGDAEADDGA